MKAFKHLKGITWKETKISTNEIIKLTIILKYIFLWSFLDSLLLLSFGVTVYAIIVLSFAVNYLSWNVVLPLMLHFCHHFPGMLSWKRDSERLHRERPRVHRANHRNERVNHNLGKNQKPLQWLSWSKDRKKIWKWKGEPWKDRQEIGANSGLERNW